MSDWSEIFEKRLSAVLSLGNEHAKSGTAHELTLPPTVNKDDGPAVCDPTASFFDSISKTKRPDDYRERIERNERSTPYLANIHTPDNAESRGDGCPAVRQLQESYSERANDLHNDATKRLADTQKLFEEQLSGIAQEEQKFLSSMAQKHALFGKPPAEWAVKIQTRETGNGTKHTEREERLVDRISKMQAAAATLEGQLAVIWKEWDRANGEAESILQAIFQTGKDNSQHGAGGDSFDKIMADAERELEAAAAEAMRETQENEKASLAHSGSLASINSSNKQTFRKLILAEECKLAQSMLARQSKYD